MKTLKKTPTCTACAFYQNWPHLNWNSTISSVNICSNNIAKRVKDPSIARPEIYGPTNRTNQKTWLEKR